jgi:hypothetical protein
MKPSDFSSTNIGRNIQVAARVITPLIALAITTAELAFWLGHELRLALDERNDQLAAWWVAALGLSSAPAPALAPAPSPTTISAVIPTITPEPIMITPTRKPRTKKAAVAAPPAPPAAPAPKRPRPAKRAPKRTSLEAVAA